MNWKKLQNGSDIRGVALDGVIGEKVNLNPEVAEMLGKSFVLWLQINTTHTAISVERFVNLLNYTIDIQLFNLHFTLRGYELGNILKRTLFVGQ